MNPLDYGSLEACRRLVDAGIVLETEAVWYVVNADLHYKEHVKIFLKDAPEKYIPAPSMAEVWRELPSEARKSSLLLDKSSAGDTYAGYVIPASVADSEKEIYGVITVNPTDALISLLVWARKGKP